MRAKLFYYSGKCGSLYKYLQAGVGSFRWTRLIVSRNVLLKVQFVYIVLAQVFYTRLPVSDPVDVLADVLLEDVGKLMRVQGKGFSSDKVHGLLKDACRRDAIDDTVEKYNVTILVKFMNELLVVALPG
jgi:hypothetical protein